MADVPMTAPSTARLRGGGGKTAKITRPTPDHREEKTPESTDEVREPEMGSRIKRIRNKTDSSSERAAELLSQLHTKHREAVLQAEQKPTRTVKEYADSGLRSLRLKQNDLPAFPPVGFGL